MKAVDSALSLCLRGKQFQRAGLEGEHALLLRTCFTLSRWPHHHLRGPKASPRDRFFMAGSQQHRERRRGAFPLVCRGGFSPNWSQEPLTATRGPLPTSTYTCCCKSQSRREFGGEERKDCSEAVALLSSSAAPRSGPRRPRVARDRGSASQEGSGPGQVPARHWGAALAVLTAEPGADLPWLPPHLQRAPVCDFDAVSERDSHWLGGSNIWGCPPLQ